MKVKPFKFSLASSDLSASIRKATSVVAQGVYAILGLDKKLYVLGAANEYKVAIQIPNANSDSDGIFGAELEYLEGIAKGRNVLELDFDGKQCNFKAVKTKYSGHIATSSLSDDVLSMMESLFNGKSEKTSLSSELLAAMRKTLAMSAIHDVYHGTNLISYVQVAKNKLCVTCFDAQHFSMATCKVKASDLRIAMPTAQFILIDSLSDGDIKITSSSSGFTVSGAMFKAVLPAVQAEDKHFAMVPNFVKALSDPEFSCSFDYDQLLGVIENLRSLYKANTAFSLSSGKKELNISISSAAGSANDSIKVNESTGSFKAQVDPRLFKDSLDAAKTLDKTSLSVFKRVLLVEGSLDEGDTKLYVACARTE